MTAHPVAATDAAARAQLESRILERLTPTTQEQRDVARDVADLLAAADQALAAARLSGRATMQGSIAKGTWLAGGGDLDLFLLLDPSVPTEKLEGAALAVGAKILESAQKRYAQHPYLVGTFRGRSVDLVPAYAVASAAAKMSAVDRTPFHTTWVTSRLDDAARAQVRLAKRWLKGVGVYGAQTAVGGFSGYLVEVLIAHFGSFAHFLDWLAAEAKPRRIVSPTAQGANRLDQVNDEVSPLVVVDPVDPARNCSAAVTVETLALACEAARSYIANPQERFFFPAPPHSVPAATLHAHQQRVGESWQALLLRPRTDRLDIVFPQFQKAARAIAAHLETEGFPLVRLRSHADEASPAVLLEWVTKAVELPERRIHKGPPAVVPANAARFAAKYTNHPDALGPVTTGEDDRVQVELAIRHRSAFRRLAADLASLQLGRHVTDALGDARHWSDPAEATPDWAAAVADTILDRRPWQR
ncbi:MAG: CCA tRNA nucleotidyltransferase [Candidatus Thermoplasmatota archaeon]